MERSDKVFMYIIALAVAVLGMGAMALDGLRDGEINYNDGLALAGVIVGSVFFLTLGVVYVVMRLRH